MGLSPQRCIIRDRDRCIIGDSGPRSPVQARARRDRMWLRQPPAGSRYRVRPLPENAYVVQIRARRGRGCADDGVGLRGIAGARTAHPARTSRIGAQLARVGAPGLRRLVGSRVGGDVRRDRTARRHQGQGPADLRRLRQPERRRAIRRRTGAGATGPSPSCSGTRDAPSSTWPRHASCCRTCRSGPSRARTCPRGCRRPTSATTRSTAIC